MLGRLKWELYSFRVGIRRWILDLFLPPGRRADLLRRSCTFRDWDEAIFAVPAPVSVEPRYGYLVSGRFGVIEESVMSSQCVRLRSHRTFFSGVPTLPELLSADRRKATPAAPLVSIQHAFGSNYYHLVVDCLGALALIDEHDELADSHIVVGPDLAETSAFAEMVELGVIPRDRLIVRRERWITSDQPIAFVQQEALTAHALRRTAAYVARVTPPASDRGVESKLYVTRGLGGFGRGLRNEAELVLALERRDFEVIDPGSLSWEEQHVRFRAATHVVGVHGAALTNILYRWPSALSLLEISAPGQTAEVFKMMAGSLDYRFARVDGSAPRGRGDRPSFVVDVAALLDIVDGWEKNNVGAGAPPGVPPA